MIKNIENNKQLKQAVSIVLFEGKKIPFAKTSPAINLGVMFGILVERAQCVAIANIVFEVFLYNHMITEKIMEQYTFGYENSQFVECGALVD